MLAGCAGQSLEPTSAPGQVRAPATADQDVDRYASGTLHTRTVQWEVPATRYCEPTVTRTEEFGRDGRLVGRTTERRTCGVVEWRTVETFERGPERTVYLDMDRDGRFDEIRVLERPPVHDMLATRD